MLATSSMVHLVFHISTLKGHRRLYSYKSDLPPDLEVEEDDVEEREAVIACQDSMEEGAKVDNE